MGLQIAYEDDNVILRYIIVGPIDNNVFFISDKFSGESIMIDAASEPEKLIPIAQQLKVQTIVQTHGHWDHIGAIPEMRKEGFVVHVAEPDAYRLSEFDDFIIDRSSYQIGRTKLTTYSTPGHTEGSVCFYLENTPLLFTGDTLFQNGPGATHFPGGDFNTIIDSIKNILFKQFDDSIVVLPGHGAATTIGQEKPVIERLLKV